MSTWKDVVAYVKEAQAITDQQRFDEYVGEVLEHMNMDQQICFFMGLFEMQGKDMQGRLIKCDSLDIRAKEYQTQAQQKGPKHQRNFQQHVQPYLSLNLFRNTEDETKILKVSTHHVDALGPVDGHDWIFVEIYLTIAEKDYNNYFASLGNEDYEVVVFEEKDSVDLARAWQMGKDFLRYRPRGDYYVFADHFHSGPSVRGILDEIRAMQHGLNYSGTSTPCQLARLLDALTKFWH